MTRALWLLLGIAGCADYRMYQPSQKTQQRNYVKSTLAPAPIDQRERAPSTLPFTEFHVRIQVDQDYRAHRVGWERRFREQLDRASRVLGPAYHVTLVLDEVRHWERHGAGTELAPLLAELVALDAGEGVDAVIGLTGAASSLSERHENLGFAQVAGNHAVLRAMDDAQEMGRLAEILDRVPAAEREALYRERLHHKEVAVLLHEWGHLVGAIHTIDAGLMNGTYDPHAQRFDAASSAVLEVALAQPAEKRRAHDPVASRALLAQLRATPAGVFDADDLARITRQLEGPPPKPPFALARPGALSEEEQRSWDKTLAAIDVHHLDEAQSLLAPLVAAHGRDAIVLALACRVAAERSPPDAAGRATCRRAADLERRDASSLLRLARMLLAGPDARPGIATLREADERMKRVQDTTPVAWAALAELYAAANCVSWAGRAAVRAGQDAARVLAWETLARRRHGLSPDSARTGVPADEEPQLIAALVAIDARPNDASATTLRAQLLARFPMAPAVLALEGKAQLHTRHAALARKLCERAVAIDEEALTPHVCLAAIAAREHRAADADTELTRAIALDPESEPQLRALVGRPLP